jgi:hypothetical protein
VDWDRVNRWLTLGANLGVLVGIVLILMELNQNADLWRAQISQSRVDSVLERYADQMHSDYWPPIAAKRQNAGSPEKWVETLTDEEWQRVRYYVLIEINDLLNQFYQYQQGWLDPSIWQSSTRGQIVRVLPLIPHFFPQGMPLEPAFREAINQIAREEDLPLVRDRGSWQADYWVPE